MGPVEEWETCARSKNYPNPWDSASSGVESRQPKVPWVNESATPGEWLHPRASRYVYGLPPQGWLLLAWTLDIFAPCPYVFAFGPSLIGEQGSPRRANLCKTLLPFVSYGNIGISTLSKLSTFKIIIATRMHARVLDRRFFFFFLILTLRRNSPAHHFVSKKDPTHFRIFILSLVHDGLK